MKIYNLFLTPLLILSVSCKTLADETSSDKCEVDQFFQHWNLSSVNHEGEKGFLLIDRYNRVRVRMNSIFKLTEIEFITSTSESYEYSQNDSFAVTQYYYKTLVFSDSNKLVSGCCQ